MRTHEMIYTLFDGPFCLPVFIKALERREHPSPVELFAEEIGNRSKRYASYDVQNIVLLDIHSGSEDKQRDEKRIDPEPLGYLLSSSNAQIA